MLRVFGMPLPQTGGSIRRAGKPGRCRQENERGQRYRCDAAPVEIVTKSPLDFFHVCYKRGWEIVKVRWMWMYS